MKAPLILSARLALVAATALCFSATGFAAEVAENWNKHCASCHAKDGSGSTKMGKKLSVKDYRDAKAQEGFTDDAALKAIKEGAKDSAGKETMKPFAEKLSDDEAKALVAYVRSLKAK
jgi:mono/diheme cytochrome c family protein